MNSISFGANQNVGSASAVKMQKHPALSLAALDSQPDVFVKTTAPKFGDNGGFKPFQKRNPDEAGPLRNGWAMVAYGIMAGAAIYATDFLNIASFIKGLLKL